jgi:dipeptide transport system substrate-binding protein
MKHFFVVISLLLIAPIKLYASNFVYCSEASPVSFNPQLTTDGASHNASVKTLYNRLFEFKLGSTEVEPSLVESYSVSKDQKVFTFKLRKDVKFHQTKDFTPTRNFNADDVIFSFDRQRLKDHPYHNIGGGNYDYFSGMEMGTLIKDIKKIDDHTIEMTLSKTEAPILANLAMGFMSILSKEYADQLLAKKKAANIDTNPVGTGPFILERYSKDTMIRYKKNPNYFLAPTQIENLIIAITPEPSVRFQKLRRGECHLIIEPPLANKEAMAKDLNINIIQGPGLNVGYLAMNVQKKPFDNVLVRRAINHALDKASYINAIYLGEAILAKNPLPPTMWSYNKEIIDYEYNPEKARELLKQAGFENGFETEIWTLPVTRPYNPNGKKMGEMMQMDLAKVGIKAKLITYDWSTYLEKSRAGEHAMIQLGWTGDNGDPDNFLNVLLGCAGVANGANVAKWCNKEFNDLILKAKSISDQKEREKLYKKAQEIVKLEAPWVPLAHSLVFRAMSTKVNGYVLDPLGGDSFYNIGLEK